MNTVLRSILALVFALASVSVAAPAFSAEAVHIFRCEQEDGATEEDVVAVAQQWLTAARKSKGGEGMQVQVLFPLAVNATQETDFLFLVTAPSIAQWGVFWENFHDSPVSEVDQGTDEKVICPDSALWESETVVVKP
jgi:hypothetical protein